MHYYANERDAAGERAGSEQLIEGGGSSVKSVSEFSWLKDGRARGGRRLQKGGR